MKFIQLFLILLIVSCSFPSPRQQSINGLAKRVKDDVKSLGLEIGGVGSFGPNKIEAIKFYFISDRVINIPQARKLGLHVVNAILCAGQDDKSFQEQLADSMFSENNIYMSIVFADSKDDENFIDHVSFSPVGIQYSKRNRPLVRYETIYNESYEEARQITDAESN